MSISFEWIIEQMKVYSEKDKFKNVVFNCDWRVNASDDKYIATEYGSVEINHNENNNFINYNDLTKEDVINWVKLSLGNDKILQIKNNLENEINARHNPKFIINQLPWDQQNSI